MPGPAHVVYEHPTGSERLWIGDRWRVGRFVRASSSSDWRVENQIGTYPLLVFPSVPVRIEQAGKRPVIANPATAVLYDPGTPYRRGLLDPRGDRCHYVALDAASWADVVSRCDPTPRSDGGFRVAGGPVRPELRLAFERVLRDLTCGAPTDLEIEETLLELAAAVLVDALDVPSGRRGTTGRRHRDAALELEEVLSRRFRGSDTLAELAACVGLSPFHAARVFRHETGRSLHAYRDALRLAASLSEIASGERLDTVALGLGFTSHAHFSDRFRRAFGVPPSVARSLLRARS